MKENVLKENIPQEKTWKGKAKRFLKICLVFLVLSTVFLLLVTIVHMIMTSKEKKSLGNAGYINTVTVGKTEINYSVYGKADGKHKIVTISGLGVNDYAVMSHYMLDELAVENYIINIDREGYGFSDDSRQPQTAAHIVDVYRKTLKQLGIEAPYILLPHSIGGVYATYWECTYPDEIEAIAFLDSSEITEGASFEDMDITLVDYLTSCAAKTGIQRLAYNKLFIGPPPWVEEPVASYARYLNIHGSGSFACNDESRLANENLQTAYNALTKTDMPKIYINASSSFETTEDFVEYIKYANANLTAGGRKEYFNLDDSAHTEEVAKKYIASCAEWRESRVMPYIEALGNCEYIGIPGDHLIYEHKPEDVKKALNSFINSLN